MTRSTNKLGESSDQTNSKYKLMFIGTPDTQQRIEAIQGHLVTALGEAIPSIIIPFKKFSNTAWKVLLEKSVRDKVVYIYSDVESNYDVPAKDTDGNSRYQLSKFIINAAKNAGAKSINVIYPSYPYARSDKPEKSGKSFSKKRPPFGAAMVANDLGRSKVDYLFTFDIHNTAILSHFGSDYNPTRYFHLDHNWVIEEVINQTGLVDFELGSTDLGGTDKLQLTAEDYGVNHWVALKARDLSTVNKVKQLLIYNGFATLTDKDLLLYDDILDTAGTAEVAIEKLSEYKPRSITCVFTHGLFNGPAIEILQKLYNAGKIKAVYITDSVYREELPSFIKVISTDKILAHNIALRAKEKPLEYNRHDPETN